MPLTPQDAKLLRPYIDELTNAMYEALNTSSKIDNLFGEVQKKGYNLRPLVEITWRGKRIQDPNSSRLVRPDGKIRPRVFRRNDVKFLKEMRIQLNKIPRPPG